MAPTGPGLVGRATELAGLAARLDTVAAGRGGLVLLSGEPGIGKSSLAAAVADQADRRGMAVAVGRCPETAGAPAYWPWTQVLRSVLGGTRPDAVLEPLVSARPGTAAGSDRFRLFDAATELLTGAAAGRPLLVVLDDLHRADEASLALLRFLAPALHRNPLLLLGAYRTTEVPAGHPLSRLLGEVAGELAFELVELSGLDPVDTERLAAGIPQAAGLDIAELHARTGGNPFFLTEVLRLGPAGADRTPASVDAAIRARLRRLPDDTRDLLELAAVLGRDVDVQLLAALADRSPLAVLDGLDPAVGAGLLTADPAEPMAYRFVHILVQRVLYDGQAAPRRALLHDRVVTALDGRPDDSAGAARIAHHAVCAVGVPGGQHRAFALACAAARSAAERLADEEAADWYGCALDLGPPGGREAVALLLELGRCAGRSGRAADARAAFERAWALGAEHGDDDALVRAALGLGAVVVSAGRVDAGLVRMLERTLGRLEPGAEADRIRLGARLATELYWGAELPRSRDLATRAVAAARTAGDDRALAAALGAAQFVLRGPDGLTERIALGTELVGLAARLRDEEAELAARRMLIPDLLQCDPVLADAQLAALADLAATGRRSLARWYVLVFRALRAIMAGTPGALDLVERAHALGRRIRAQPAPVYAAGQRFMLRDRLDGTAALESDLRRLGARYPVLSVFRCQLAVVLAEAGRTAEAAALLDELTADDFAALPPDSLWLANLGLLAGVAARLDDTAPAATLHDRLTPYGGRIATQGVPTWSGAVDRFLGLTASTLGRWDEAEERFRAALRVHEAWGAVPLVARTLDDHAAMLRRRGAPGDRQRAGRLGAQAAALAGAPPVPAAGTGRADGLTGREDEVLAMVAGGASNKEIARRLGVSVHTVERHVANVYAKIGARNRAEATAFALRRAAG